MPFDGLGLFDWYGYHQYVPYVGHLTDDILALHDGSLLAMGRMRGAPHELLSVADKKACAISLNNIWLNQANDIVTVHVHFVRHAVEAEKPDLSRFTNSFSREFVSSYHEKVLCGLYQNDWFLSLVVCPPGSPDKRRTDFDRNAKMVDGLWHSMAGSLAAYRPQRIDVRETDDDAYSEMAETLRLFLYGEKQEIRIPAPSEPIGHAIYSNRVFFGSGRQTTFTIPSAQRNRFGAIIGFLPYMAETRPGIMDPLLQLPMPVVIHQSYQFMARPDAVGSGRLKRNQMASASDEAGDDLLDLTDALRKISAGRTAVGRHNITIAVYGGTQEELDHNLSHASRVINETLASAAPEDRAKKAAYFSQLPGARLPILNGYLRARPGKVPSENFAHLVNFASYPEIRTRGRWDDRPLITLKTTANTAYPFYPHAGEAGDVGMTAIFGPTGSGKTTFLMALLALYDGLIGEGGRIFFIDKGRGGELLTRSVGGAYRVFQAGEPTGCAPLRGLTNTAPNREFLSDLLRAAVQLGDGLGPFPAEDHERLAIALREIMRMPAELRCIEAVRRFLYVGNPLGLHERLGRWCAGGDRGWVFDGERDDLNFAARMSGFDFTALLGIPDVMAPLAHCLIYRMRSMEDGRRIVMSLDECPTYLTHALFRREVQDLLQTARKANVIVYLVAQMIEQLLEGEFGSFGQTIIEQCSTKVFFRNPKADEAVHRGRLKQTEGQFLAVQNMPPGSYRALIQRDGPSGDESVIIDADMSAIPDYVAVLSSTLNRIRFAEEIRRERPGTWQTEYRQRFREVVD